ncbi:ABC transporter permease [Desulfovibrio mangrovi]|uniref:ABC transporter permease n=1 Tax=Desulfovibrio mangrovi TaxID=2976983 RepID=UPI002245B7CB|nr:ABC transporter permease [Desulfovibrio mangrovi]UZP68206.1 ABC transporter permease [Desulfovibrio mangrovi]
MAHSFVERVGAAALHRLNGLRYQGSLFLGAFFALLALHPEDASPESIPETQYKQPLFGNLRNPAILKALLAELHAQAVSSLPLITCLALALGSIVVNLLLSLLTQLDAYDSIGEYLAPAMLRELAPLSCALVMLLRSAPTIVTGCGILSLNHEATSLANMGIGIAAYRHAPIYLAALIGTPLLALYFSLFSLIGGFFIFGYLHDITFDSYMDQLLYGTEFTDLIILFLKAACMALAVSTPAVAHGMRVISPHDVGPRIVSALLQGVGYIVGVEILFLAGGM